jgi:hypothetical protein
MVVFPWFVLAGTADLGEHCLKLRERDVPPGTRTVPA